MLFKYLYCLQEGDQLFLCIISVFTGVSLDHAPIEAEPLAGTGLMGALQLAKRKGYLEQVNDFLFHSIQ